ncbi:MAG: hypothetical protein M3Y42_17620 [Actinomycetota bacterium]|nr:hypothetical protein [Actinomycetota bacterium]MDQ2958763.1 hypothetical protein [Actinomycetota bacterium]
MSTGFDHDHVDPPGAPRRESTTMVLVAAAIAWGFLVILAAMTVPIVTLQASPVTATATASPSPGASVTPDQTGDGQQLYESPRVTVLRHDGLAGVAVASVPAAISLLVAGLLWVGSRGRRTVLVPIAAWALSTALVVAGIVGFVTILVGVVAVPSGVLLVIACSQAQWRPRTVPAMSARA